MHAMVRREEFSKKQKICQVIDSFIYVIFMEHFKIQGALCDLKRKESLVNIGGI